jgi:acetolactate synthase-1/2/3 large subunit
LKLSDYVLQFVAAQGVKHVFLVTGGGAMHLNQSLGEQKSIEPVCNSHEQASAMGAEAYAKVTNDLGVCMVTTGPGGTNAITGVAGAWLDSTPVLFLSGQVKRPDRMFAPDGKPLGMRQLGVQEVDIVSIVKPITKYAVTILNPADIRYHLEKAAHLAITGRPGPVWVDIPLDVQASPIEDPSTLRAFEPDSPSETGGHTGSQASQSASLKEEVANVIAQLNQAERPLLFAGNGIRLARATQEFEQLRHLLNIPSVATWCAADMVPSDEPTFVGRPGSVAARGANFALQNCDFLLSIGVRLDFAITGYAPQNLAREAHKVAVDIDAAELAKLEPHLQQPIHADARAFLTELLAQKDAIKLKDHTAWDARCIDWKTRYPVVTDEHRKPSGQVSIYNLAEVIGTQSNPTDLLVSGSSGAGIEIFLLACPTRNGQRIYHTAGLGAMGYGLPMSIAVSIGGGRRQTILVDGDGGFQFNIQELETISRLQLPIKMFVLNNDGYASIRASQTAYFGRANIGCDDRTGLTVPDLTKVANSYNIPAVVIADQTNLREEVAKILATPGPVVVDVRVIPDEIRAPRLSSFQKPDGSFVSKPLEDLFPFLDREEFFANMIVKPLPE